MKGRWLILAVAAVLAMGCKPASPEIPVIPDDYQTWQLSTDTELNYPIPGHLNHYRKIYANRTAFLATTEPSSEGRTWTYPPGSMFVKEVYSTQDTQPGAEPFQLTVMLKDPSSPLAQEGWVYLVKDVAAGTTQVIPTQFCLRCHQGANVEHVMGVPNPNGEFRDYIFFPVGGD